MHKKGFGSLVAYYEKNLYKSNDFTHIQVHFYRYRHTKTADRQNKRNREEQTVT